MQIKKDYTREQIVEIAKRVFLKNGYAKTSMRDIAAGAGIGVSNIYNYFKSEDELFRHIVGLLITELEQHVGAADLRLHRRDQRRRV